MKQLYCILTLLAIIGSVSALECYEPFKNINNTCCEDHNNNTVCDYDDMQKLPIYNDTVFATTTSTTLKARSAEELIALEKDPSSATTLPPVSDTTATTTTETTTSYTIPSTTLAPSATITTQTVPPTTQTTQPTTKPTIQNTRPMPTITTIPNGLFGKISNGSYNTIALILFAFAVIAIVLYKLGSEDD